MMQPPIQRRILNILQKEHHCIIPSSGGFEPRRTEFTVAAALEGLAVGGLFRNVDVL